MHLVMATMLNRSEMSNEKNGSSFLTNQAKSSGLATCYIQSNNYLNHITWWKEMHLLSLIMGGSSRRSMN